MIYLKTPREAFSWRNEPVETVHLNYFKPETSPLAPKQCMVICFYCINQLQTPSQLKIILFPQHCYLIALAVWTVPPLTHTGQIPSVCPEPEPGSGIWCSHCPVCLHVCTLGCCVHVTHPFVLNSCLGAEASKLCVLIGTFYRV